MIGAYDIGIPTFKNTLPDYFDFHCFTDQKRLTSDLWNMHYIQELPVSGDVSKSAYHYKWKAHELFDVADYDIVIWMDASAYDVKLENIKAEVEKFKSMDTAIHIEEHPSRSKSLKQECEINCRLNKDNVSIMQAQVERYYKEGYKESLGILVPETGFSIRKFKDSRCIAIGDKIIDEMTGTDRTKRDQLVWNYAVWKTGTRDAISMFSFQHKMENLVKFRDHAHREKHIEKVLLIGPWLGDDHIESYWIEYVKQYLSNTPVDRVIVGCKKGRESLYNDLSPDRVVGVDPKGTAYKHLVDGNAPTFDIKVSGEKEVIRLSPTTDIINSIYRPTITILWCTVRPKMMVSTYNYWLSTASSTDNINLVVGVDTEADCDELIQLGIDRKNIVIVPKNPTGKRGVTWPSYCLSSNLVCAHRDDIVIFASDDFFPSFSWDVDIIKHLSDFDGCLIVNDKLSGDHKIVTIPIMTYGCLVDNNKVIYNPAYGHAFSDQELHDTLTSMKRLKDISKTYPNVVFDHRHWVANGRGKDEHDEYQVSKHMDERAIYTRRSKLPLAGKQRVNMFEKKLSILICSLEKRSAMLNKLLEELTPQVMKYNNAVEICIDVDNGERAIGAKRNALLDAAKGEYIAFVDDDDMVSKSYVDLIMLALQKNPDCCSLNGMITLDRNKPRVFKHSLKYKFWYEDTVNGEVVYYRCPNHLNAVHIDIARSARFNDSMSFQEDKDYSDRMLPMLTTEAVIDETLYYYNAVSSK